MDYLVTHIACLLRGVLVIVLIKFFVELVVLIFVVVFAFIVVELIIELVASLCPEVHDAIRVDPLKPSRSTKVVGRLDVRKVLQ